MVETDPAEGDDARRRPRIPIDDHLADARRVIERGHATVDRARTRIDRSEAAINGSSRRINRDVARNNGDRNRR